MQPMLAAYIFLAVVAGGLLGFGVPRVIGKKRMESANELAKRIIEEAR